MVTYKFLAYVVHHTHDTVLVPPAGVLNALDLALHDDNLASRDQLSAAIGRSQMGRNSRRSHIAAQGLCQAVDELGPLFRGEDVRGAGGQDKVAVEIDNQSIRWSSEKRAAFDGNTKNVRARFFYKLLGMAGVHNWDVESAPLVHTHTEANCFSGNSQDSRVVTAQNNPASWRYGCLDNADNVRDRETAEERPHGEVLETSRRGWELIAKGIVLHVNADQVVQTRRGEAEDSRNLFGMEQVGSFVPMDPHSAEVISQKIVERVARQEAQAVRDPVRLIGVVVVVGLGFLAQFANGVGSLFIGTGPYFEGNAVESVR